MKVSQENRKRIEQIRAREVGRIHSILSSYDGASKEPIGKAIFNLAGLAKGETSVSSSKIHEFEQNMATANAIARKFRSNTRMSRFPSASELVKSGALSKDALMKANLDVGTLTNFAQVTGGQSLGYVSLDTRMARGTVRPNSFTLYQALSKSAAFQVVDFWPYAIATGGPLPGSAFANYSSVSSGTLATDAGLYELNYITLKLALDGRAITVALAAQNSFVDVQEQENANAALSVMETINWANYWGNSSIYSNQYDGIYQSLFSTNIFDFQEFYTSDGSANGWSNPQTLFNLIYDAAADITEYRTYGQITHAFMSPTVASDLQGLVTTLLNNIVTTITPEQVRAPGIVVDGDLQGMRTRFGVIQFPIDIFINARNRPAQAIILNEQTGAYRATTSNPTPPASVTVAVVAPTVSGSAWSGAYVTSGGIYTYAVASMDASMNESVLTYASPVSGIAANGAYRLTINPPGANDMAAFRIYRSGLGYNTTPPNPAAFRYIADVAANGANAVTFTDLNAWIPGSETIFLLDLEEEDQALDFRYLLPLTRIELFAQNLYMPWAVAMIGAIRVKVPKFHGAIKNYVPTNPQWNPLAPYAG